MFLLFLKMLVVSPMITGAAGQALGALSLSLCTDKT